MNDGGRRAYKEEGWGRCDEEVLLALVRERLPLPPLPPGPMTSTAVPTVTRRAVLQALEALLVESEAEAGVPNAPLELEHAIFCFSANGGTPYRREAFRMLHLWETHPQEAADFLRTKGPLALAATPLALVLNAEGEDVAVQPNATYECEQRLAAYCTQGTVQLPDAGTQCGRCRSRDIKFEMLQTRSADEPMSIFCTCERCGKRWRM